MCRCQQGLLTGWNAPASLTRSAGSHSICRLQRDTRSCCCPHYSPSQMLPLIFSGGFPIIWLPEFPGLSVGPANKALIGIINISEEARLIPGNIPPRAPQREEKKGWDGVSFYRRAREGQNEAVCNSFTLKHTIGTHSSAGKWKNSSPDEKAKFNQS